MMDLQKLETAITLFKSGTSISEIAKIVNRSNQTVVRWLRNSGNKERKSRIWVNSEYFDNIDSEEKAYLLGFFIADGCVRIEKDNRYGNMRSIRMCLSNSIDDIDIIKLFHKAICPNNILQYVHNKTGAKNRKPQISIQWTSNHMSTTLMEKYKILPLKTHDANFKFPFETIPKELQRHFVRGFLDGDGCIQNDGLRFVFNSKEFMFQIMKIFEEFFEKVNLSDSDKFHYKYYTCIGKTVDYYKCFIAKGFEKQYILRDFLYKDATIYLNRKFEKIQQWKIKKKGRPKGS